MAEMSPKFDDSAQALYQPMRHASIRQRLAQLPGSSDLPPEERAEVVEEELVASMAQLLSVRPALLTGWQAICDEYWNADWRDHESLTGGESDVLST
jgi:hypothetical protein